MAENDNEYNTLFTVDWPDNDLFLKRIQHISNQKMSIPALALRVAETSGPY